MKYGLIGEKLCHSWSCEIHGKISDYAYELCEIPRDGLDSFMQRRDFCGINVTIPYKQDVMRYLDGISDEARKIGAVNTVVNRDGKLYGYNTDIIGMEMLLSKAGIGVSGRKTAILGTGGTSKTARTLAEKLGASEIVTVSRTEKDGNVSYETLAERHRDVEIIINTTPVGMYPNSKGMPIDPSDYPCLKGVCDVIYNPLRTRLVQKARALGIAAEGGLYMLCAQAVAASALFGNAKADLSAVSVVFGKTEREKQNVFLIGMPTSGKSTVGKALSKLTGAPFYDADTVFEEKYGKTPAMCIREDGEPCFREREALIISELSALNGCITATGGGAILLEENVISMKQNGICVYLDRPFENLFVSDTRPLSSNTEQLKQMYVKREPIYRAASDLTVKGGAAPYETAKDIIGRINNEIFDFERAEH